MVVSTLRGCTPFVVCGVVSAFTEWRLGTLIGLALSLLLLILNRWAGNARGEVIFEASAVVFCGVAAVVAFSARTLPVNAYIGSLSVGWQALTAWGSLGARRPFTLDAAKREDPGHLRTHLVIVGIWAAGFTATALVLALMETLVPHSGVAEIVVQVAGNLATALAAHRYASTPRSGAAPAAPLP